MSAQRAWHEVPDHSHIDDGHELAALNLAQLDVHTPLLMLIMQFGSLVHSVTEDW